MKAKVTQKPNGLAVDFKGNHTGTGTGSQISWENESLMEGLRRAFQCKPEEKIVSVEINHLGVKAYFVTED